MRIRPAWSVPRVRPARVVRRGLRRALAVALGLTLLAPVVACHTELVPPGAPTAWPAESARRWQWQWQLDQAALHRSVGREESFEAPG